MSNQSGLDKEIEAVASELVDGALASRHDSIAQRISAKQSLLAAKGVLISGGAIYALSAVANEELRTTAATIWTALMSSLRAMPPTPASSIKGDVQALFLGMFSTRYETVQSVITPAFKTSGASVTHLGVEMVHKMYEAVLKRYLAEIALWAAAYERTNVSSAPAAATYVFHGSVGSVQTGANSTATVVQNLSAIDIEPLLDGLKKLTSEINSLPHLDADRDVRRSN